MNFKANPPFNEMRQGFATFKKETRMAPQEMRLYPNFLISYYMLEGYMLCFYYLLSALNTATKALWGMATEPIIFIRFFPFFCFSRSLRFLVMSPP